MAIWLDLPCCLHIASLGFRVTGSASWGFCAALLLAYIVIKEQCYNVRTLVTHLFFSENDSKQQLYVFADWLNLLFWIRLEQSWTAAHQFFVKLVEVLKWNSERDDEVYNDKSLCLRHMQLFEQLFGFLEVSHVQLVGLFNVAYRFFWLFGFWWALWLDDYPNWLTLSHWLWDLLNKFLSVCLDARFWFFYSRVSRHYLYWLSHYAGGSLWLFFLTTEQDLKVFIGEMRILKQIDTTLQPIDVSWASNITDY